MNFWTNPMNQTRAVRLSQTPWSRTVVKLLVLASLVVGGVVAASNSPEVAKGVAWLLSRVQGVSVLDQDQSVGTPLQVRADVAETLKALAALPAPLVQGVSDEAGALDTESLARKIIASSELGRGLDTVLADLASRQNADGGFGEDLRSYRDHAWRGRGESTASQTAWALLAYHAAGESASPAVERAVRWLVGRP